jgi:hypothetical protein
MAVRTTSDISLLSGGHQSAGRLGHSLQRIGSVVPRAAGNADFTSPGAAPAGIAGDVVGDGKQPRGKLGARDVRLAGSVNAQEHVLRQILSLFSRMHQVLQHHDQPALVAHDQFLEGRGVAVAHLQHQPHVRVRLFVLLRTLR